MSIVREPFTRTRTDEERAKDNSTVESIRLNKEERAKLMEANKFYQQLKISTLIKQFAMMQADRVLHDREMQLSQLIAMNNVRRNMETGVPMDLPNDRKFLGFVGGTDENL